MGTAKRTYRQLTVEPDRVEGISFTHNELVFKARVDDLLALVGESWEEDTEITVKVVCVAEDDPRETAMLEFSFDQVVLS